MACTESSKLIQKHLKIEREREEKLRIVRCVLAGKSVESVSVCMCGWVMCMTAVSE